MKAVIPAEAVAKYQLVPGQGMAADVYTGESGKGLSVPNVALIAEGGKTYVEVREGGKLAKREVELGARGTARSEVTKGLKSGDAVVLTPAANLADPDARRFSAPGDSGRGGRGGGGMQAFRPMKPSACWMLTPRLTDAKCPSSSLISKMALT